MVSRSQSTSSRSSVAESPDHCVEGGAPTRRIALLDPQMSFVAAQLANPVVRAAVEPIDLYTLPEVDLTPYHALIVPAFADQEFLFRERARLRAFLDDGKVLLFNGHLFRPWLPGGAPFAPKTIRSHRDYAVKIVAPHPIFAGVAADDLTYRRGVAGFFARGSHPPPDGAEVLVAFTSGDPIFFIDRRSTGGTVVLHSGNDLRELAGIVMTAGRVVPQLFTWMGDEYRALQRGDAR